MPVAGIGSNNFLQVTTAQPKYAKQPSNTTTQPSAPIEQKKSKTPIIVASVALAALGVTAAVGHKRGWFAGSGEKIKEAFTSVKGGASGAKKGAKNKVAQEMAAKFSEIKKTYQTELKDILLQNNGKDLGVFDKIAGDISGAVNRGENRFHFALSILEESYISAYSKAELKNGKNMFNWIADRIEKESVSIPLMYAQLSKPEAEHRLMNFAADIAMADQHTGMTKEEFIKLFHDKFFQKGIDKLAELTKK